MKKEKFKEIYLDAELYNNKTLLYGVKGEATHIFKIENLVEEYSSKEDLYVNYHSILLNIVKVLGEGYHLQKLDIFSKKEYKKENAENFLQKSYENHFEGRIGVNIDTYLCIVKLYEGNYQEKKFKEFIEKLDKVEQMLNEVTYVKSLNVEETLLFTKRILALNFTDESFYIPNMAPTDTSIGRGDLHTKVVSIIDVDKIDLPSTISPYVYTNNEQIRSFPVDLMSFLMLLKDYETLIYNQVIAIPKQQKEIAKLKTKQKRHSGIPDPANDICVEDIELLLTDVAKESQLVVEGHFSLVLACRSKDKLESCQNNIASKLFEYNITPSDSSYNQLELYRSVFPGNTVELKKYDWFLTTSHAALCFFFKEKQVKDDESSFYLKYTNRQGLPIKFDPEELPQTQKKIGNRNSFVLGPSGSGKSFLTNSIVEQKLHYNYDIVIVDTGDSYSGIASYFNAKYIQWKDDSPITMNPFKINKEELNIEKRQFLKSLILLCWKGVEGGVTSIEEDVINDVINAYYENYFGEEINDSNIDINNIKKRLEANGIDTEKIYEEVKQEYNNKKSVIIEAYSVLGLEDGKGVNEVKKAYRELAKKYHPDKNPNINEEKYFVEVNRAYNILLEELNTTKKNKINIWVEDIYTEEETKETNDKLQKLYEEKLVELYKELADYKISELSFNSFFEFSLWKIPIVLKKWNLKERVFDTSDYNFILKKYYKGGEFEKILNEETDQSLFYEPFIVFEIDNIKEHPKLFPIVTLIIIDTFIQKMRFRENRRKQLIIEEAWKAIASEVMANNILYLYKTARKHQACVTVVTQELDDILGNKIVKNAIVNNSDSIILLDQSKFKDNFNEIAKLLSLNPIEQRKIFTINKLDNKEGRSPFKEAYWGLGGVGRILGIEVSEEQYLAYTTEKREKKAVEVYVKKFGSYEEGIPNLIRDKKSISDIMENNLFFDFINIYKIPLDERLLRFIKSIKKKYNDNANAYKQVTSRMKLEGKSFLEILKEEI